MKNDQDYMIMKMITTTTMARGKKSPRHQVVRSSR